MVDFIRADDLLKNVKRTIIIANNTGYCIFSLSKPSLETISLDIIIAKFRTFDEDKIIKEGNTSRIAFVSMILFSPELLGSL